MTGRTLIFIGIALSIALTTGCRSKAEMNLKTVRVDASAVYCLFDPSCTVTITGTNTTPIPMQSGGTALIESRTFAAKPGTPAAGLYGYEYRLDLTKALAAKIQVEEVGELNYMPCLRSVVFEFGPIVETMDYNGDKEAGDLIYVVSSGGPGKIGLQSVERYHNILTFNFDSPVCVGDPNRAGDTTFFFGLTSSKPPRQVEATIKETAGMGAASPKMKKNLKYKVPVYAPEVS